MAVRTVAVVFGGVSSEHSISCISARSVFTALASAGFTPIGIGVTDSGAWVSCDPTGLVGKLPVVPHDAPAAKVTPGPGGIEADVVFPVLHGPWGEDGTIQGLFELIGVPYVGSGVYASATSMDKGHMKTAFQAAGLRTNECVVITDASWRRSTSDCLAEVQRLNGPWFVKPARAGSSLGISKVVDPAELETAIELARTHDPKVIVEEAVANAREIECAVLVDEHGDPQASVCAEIVVNDGHAFYDFEAKYLDDSAELIVPSSLDAVTASRVQAMAVSAFNALECEGLARVDFFVSGEDVLINEVNTMPGFTAISMFPRMWMAMGMTYEQIVASLVNDALRRGTGLR